jgi:hypothetical protein
MSKPRKKLRPAVRRNAIVEILSYSGSIIERLTSFALLFLLADMLSAQTPRARVLLVSGSAPVHFGKSGMNPMNSDAPNRSSQSNRSSRSEARLRHGNVSGDPRKAPGLMRCHT